MHLWAEVGTEEAEKEPRPLVKSPHIRQCGLFPLGTESQDYTL